MKIKNMALCALFAALTAICAWIAIPLGDISFTLHSFAVVLALLTLGGKWGSVSFFVYLLLGAAGLPVFSGFRGGVGALLGVTGGYIWGFLFGGLLFWLITNFFGKKSNFFAAIIVMLTCYFCGTAWYYFAYADGTSLLLIAAKCVLPYLLPDALKLFMAFSLSRRLQRFVMKS